MEIKERDTVLVSTSIIAGAENNNGDVEVSDNVTMYDDVRQYPKQGMRMNMFTLSML